MEVERAVGGEKYVCTKICQFRSRIFKVGEPLVAKAGEVIPCHFKLDVSGDQEAGESVSDEPIDAGVDVTALKFACGYPGCGMLFGSEHAVKIHNSKMHNKRK